MDELISRKAVLDGIDKYIEKAQSTGTKDDFISFQELVVKQLPSVTPQRPKGKWIEYKVDIAPHPLHCSLCGFSNHHISNRYIREFRRCPNCGADMSGGADE